MPARQISEVTRGVPGAAATASFAYARHFLIQTAHYKPTDASSQTLIALTTTLQPSP